MSQVEREIERYVLEQLKSIRKEAGLTQKELAQRLGRPQSYVAKYEGGLRKLEVKELFAVCRECRTTARNFCAVVEGKLVIQHPQAKPIAQG